MWYVSFREARELQMTELYRSLDGALKWHQRSARSRVIPDDVANRINRVICSTSPMQSSHIRAVHLLCRKIEACEKSLQFLSLASPENCLRHAGDTQE